MSYAKVRINTGRFPHEPVSRSSSQCRHCRVSWLGGLDSRSWAEECPVRLREALDEMARLFEARTNEYADGNVQMVVGVDWGAEVAKQRERAGPDPFMQGILGKPFIPEET